MTILGSGELSVWTAPKLLTNTENVLRIRGSEGIWGGWEAYFDV